MSLQRQAVDGLTDTGASRNALMAVTRGRIPVAGPRVIAGPPEANVSVCASSSYETKYQMPSAHAAAHLPTLPALICVRTAADLSPLLRTLGSGGLHCSHHHHFAVRRLLRRHHPLHCLGRRVDLHDGPHPESGQPTRAHVSMGTSHLLHTATSRGQPSMAGCSGGGAVACCKRRSCTDLHTYFTPVRIAASEWPTGQLPP